MATRKKKQQHTKARKVATRLLIILAILLVLFLVLILITPDETPVSTSSGYVAGLELPAPRPGDVIVTHTGYTLSYNEEHEQPNWVAYELTPAEVYGAEDRGDNFRIDPTIATGSATLDDYRSSGYDRGHLIPAADLKWSAEAMSDSFYMSNMSPQAPQFNRGVWGSLEAVVRNMAVQEGGICVVTGPILTDGPYETIGKNKVSVPKQYYKVILDYSGPEYKAIGFILPNEGSKRPVADFATTVDAVEAATGLDFFPLLEDSMETSLEASVNPSQWSFKEFSASASERANPVVTSEPEAVSTLKGIITQYLQQAKRELVNLGKSLLP